MRPSSAGFKGSPRGSVIRWQRTYKLSIGVLPAGRGGCPRSIDGPAKDRIETQGSESYYTYARAHLPHAERYDMNRVLFCIGMVGLLALAGAAGDAATPSKSIMTPTAVTRTLSVMRRPSRSTNRLIGRTKPRLRRADEVEGADGQIARGDTVGSCEAFKVSGSSASRSRSDRRGGRRHQTVRRAGVRQSHRLVRGEPPNARMSWSGSAGFKDLRFIEEEAALVGAAVAKAIPAVGTLSIWAHKGAKKRMVFEAKTYGTNLGYMKVDQAAPSARPATGASLRTSASTRSCVGSQEGRGASGKRQDEAGRTRRGGEGRHLPKRSYRVKGLRRGRAWSLTRYQIRSVATR